MRRVCRFVINDVYRPGDQPNRIALAACLKPMEYGIWRFFAVDRSIAATWLGSCSLGLYLATAVMLVGTVLLLILKGVESTMRRLLSWLRKRIPVAR